MKRLASFAVIVVVCLAAVPGMNPVSVSMAPPPPLRSREVPSEADFRSLLQSDPIAALEASLARHRRDVRGYFCILQKQETLAGKLGQVEVIRNAVREDPFAVYLKWEQGGGSAAATLYAHGENAGRMRVKTRFLLETNTDPNSVLARGSSRYSIEDAGIANGTLRTIRAWQAARDRGQLQATYLGVQAVPELGGRECHLIQRICHPPEVDNFRMADPETRDPARYAQEAFTSVIVYLDCETWQQVGSVLRKADGSLLAAYWFRDIVLNPAFDPDQFRPAVLKR